MTKTASELEESINFSQKSTRKTISAFKKRNFLAKSPVIRKKLMTDYSGHILTLTSSSSNISMIKTPMRKDAYGISIIKGSKAYRVTFIDEISHVNICEVASIKEERTNTKILNNKERNTKKASRIKDTLYCSSCIII